MTSTPPSILLGMRVPDLFVQALAQRGPVLGPPPPPFPEGVAALPAQDRANVRVLVTMGTVGATAGTMSDLPALGLVCCLGSGYEGVDVAAACCTTPRWNAPLPTAFR